MKGKKIIFGCLLATVLAAPVIMKGEGGFFGIGIGPIGVGAGVGIGDGYYPGYYGGYYYYDGYYYPRHYHYPRYYYPYPAEEVYYERQQPVAVPSDIQDMRDYVMNAMDTVMSTDLEMVEDVMKQRDLMQHEGVIVRLGYRFRKEYQIYVNMLRSNDSGLSAQEEKLKKAFKSFKAQYESFAKETKG